MGFMGFTEIPPTGACDLTESTDFWFYLYTSWEDLMREGDRISKLYSFLSPDQV